MTALPMGWVSAPLVEAIELHDSRRVPLNASQRKMMRGDYPYYGANGLVDHVNDFIFDGHYVLLAEDGGNFDKPERGVAYEVQGKFWVNNHAHILTARGGIPPRFLWYWLNAIDWMPFISGTTRAKLTQAAMETVMIPLPPLAEQQRIVAKLDALMAHINHMKTDVVRIPTLIGNYKKSLLAAAISGDLTREWRTTEELPDAEDVELGSVAIDFSYGSAAKSSPSGTVPVLRMGNIQDGKLDWSNLVYTSDPAEIEKYCLIPGDVLFNRTNSPELVGKTALYDTERPAVYAGYLIRVRCSDKLSPAYLTYCLNSPIGRDYCWRVKTDGVSQSNINASKLAAFSFPLPALPEQYEIIRRIDFAFAWLDKVAAQHARAAHLLPKLDQAILAKAFRGDLVFQDPTDEPASMLLERIRAARADETRTKRSRRLRDPSTPGAPREKATMTKSRHDDDVKDRPYLADFLRQMSRPATVEDLFKRAELTLVDFYKQLAWEVDAGHIRDDDEHLEAA